jgi:tRNA U34 2-thiouridine synthase MnmA/TrmU
MVISDQPRGDVVKAVGLVSGGLDSALAVKILTDIGVDVTVVTFVMPWGDREPLQVQALARQLGVPLKVFALGEDYLEMLQHPCYGYGAAFNPCMDCHLFMMKKAAQYMREVGAEFLFTGEVLGQRSMSQRRACLNVLEKAAGLEGRLLRPLSAGLLAPTIPEQDGRVDRGRLLGLSGKGRQAQFALAKQWGITAFSPPGGGCLLTEGPFGRKMKDFLRFGFRDYRETVLLRWGRYFRLSSDFVAVLGRDEHENEQLLTSGHPDDLMMTLSGDKPGPLLILKGASPPQVILSMAAGLVQHYSKYKGEAPQPVDYACLRRLSDRSSVMPTRLEEQQIWQWRVG